MIYIPFFIVILIDMRGVREAEREEERDTMYIRYKERYKERKEASEREKEKEVSATPSTHRTPIGKRGMSQHPTQHHHATHLQPYPAA